MAFDFPANPAVDDVYTSGGVTYTFDGVVWSFSPDASTIPHVLVPGDTMTGELKLPISDPSLPEVATHKKYVDTTVANAALYQGTWSVAANIPDLNVPPNAPLNGYAYVAQTLDPAIAEIAPATIPGIGGFSIAALDTIKWSAALLEWEHIQGATGVSTMVIADGPPTGAYAGMQWWDSDSGKMYVFYSDGTSQQWVQVSGGGGGSAAGIPDDAPSDGTLYGRQDAAWTPVTGGVTTDAPSDTLLYGRQSPTVGGVVDWAEVPAAVLTDAPSDTVSYARASTTAGGPVGWVAVVAGGGIALVADTAPTGTIVNGQLWLNTSNGSLYVYWDDGTSQQWVEVTGRD